MNIYFVISFTIVLILFFSKNRGPKRKHGLPYKIIDGEKFTTGLIDKQMKNGSRRYFHSKTFFRFIEMDYPLLIMVNSNYSIFFLTRSGGDITLFMTIFKSGKIIITGNSRFELKSLADYPYMDETIFLGDFESLLKEHLNRIMEYTKNGELPIDGTIYNFFYYLGELVDINDRLKIEKRYDN
jgi:hypothetical protein